jgi:polyhydroxyalkanoate synthase subunit PhaC
VDLIPSPDQVVSAAGNLAALVAGGGLADLRPMPRTLVEEGRLRRVHHYDPVDGAHVSAAHDPVLLVSPLAAPPTCYDLRRGCSLVEHLVEAGRPTYLVEYGEVSFRDRELGIEGWLDDVVPAAIRAVSTHAQGRPVHVVGWSVGGVFALLAAAADSSLPIASIATLAAPFDVDQVPLVAPARPLLDLSGAQRPLGRILENAGAAAPPVVRWVAGLPTFQRLVTKPLALAANLDDADYLAQVEAVDRFVRATSPYPGRTFGQLYHRLLAGTTLELGTFGLDGRTVSIGDVTAPVLVVAGADDQIAPLDAVRVVVPRLTGSRTARFEIVAGGHLGMLTGRGARTGTWPVLDEWFDEHTAADDRPPYVDPALSRPVGRVSSAAAARQSAAPKKAAPKKATAKNAATKKTAAKKTTTKRTTTKKAAPRGAAAKKTPSAEAAPADPVIGANPVRRYGSAGSRDLGRRRA